MIKHCEISRGKDWAGSGIEIGNLYGADQELGGIVNREACAASAMGEGHDSPIRSNTVCLDLAPPFA